MPEHVATGFRFHLNYKYRMSTLSLFLEGRAFKHIHALCCWLYRQTRTLILSDSVKAPDDDVQQFTEKLFKFCHHAIHCTETVVEIGVIVGKVGR